VSLAGGSSFAIFARSQRKAESWALVEFLSAPEQQARFHKLCGDLPARRSAWDDPSLAGDRDLQSFRRQLLSVRPAPKVPEWERIATRIAEAAESVVRGQRAVGEALAVLDHDVDRMLEKRRFLLERHAASGRHP
jgi:multiple sugar transport system substrate-binding protein